jgi:hypothetical protein
MLRNTLPFIGTVRTVDERLTAWNVSETARLDD